jgi:DNA-binding response OmpR family regulator
MLTVINGFFERINYNILYIKFLMDTIIVQDTNPAVLDVLTLALEAEGFVVFPVQDYQTDFISIIDEHRPHVVILDYRLDGSACKEICFRTKEKYPHLPVIATSCNYNIDRLYGTDGFDGYIRKPFDLDLLYKILGHISLDLSKR